MWRTRPTDVHGARGQGDRGRQVLRLLRLRRAAAPSCPRTASSRCSAARRRRSSTCSMEPDERAPSAGVPSAYELQIAALRHRRQGRPADQLAGRDRALGLAHQDPGASRHRPADAAVARRPRTRRVRVFAANLRDLLLAAPAGPRATMGLDPGFRTGVKVAVVDATGKVVATDTIYPHEPQRHWDAVAGHARQLAVAAPRRADRDRQRHRLARDRQAGRRADQAACRS